MTKALGNKMFPGAFSCLGPVAEADYCRHPNGEPRMLAAASRKVNMSDYDEWKYRTDRDVTILAYTQTEHGGADTCDCAGCRNFRAARADCFPPKFIALLDQPGIDPLKDAEVYHTARIAPGRHDYGGWYHFIGTLDETSKSPTLKLGPGFSVWICPASAPRLTSLKGKQVVQLEFHAEAVPWLLNEPEID
jgi:hypothetical protein